MSSPADDKTKYNVIVHKAEISLLDGETLSSFSTALNAALTAWMKQKKNLGKDDWCYTCDIKAGVAVMQVYPREGASSFWAVNYERDENGAFSFTDLTEVRPVMNYVPVAPSLVQKAKEVEVAKAKADIWVGVI